VTPAILHLTSQCSVKTFSELRLLCYRYKKDHPDKPGDYTEEEDKLVSYSAFSADCNTLKAYLISLSLHQCPSVCPSRERIAKNEATYKTINQTAR
jgi:hypothetical protein